MLNAAFNRGKALCKHSALLRVQQLVAIFIAQCYLYRMTTQSPHSALSRRERQIMDILYRRGRATAAEVQSELPGGPAYSTVRTQLRVLESKGHVRHDEEGLRYVYSPALPRPAASASALRHLVDTFFEGSTEKVVAALLGSRASGISREELDRIAELVARARKED
jgi:BlaI family transcriptional regulator, penicillinase repressor